MRTLANDAKADQMLDFLASGGTSGDWTYFAEMREWESLYNLWEKRYLVGRLARNLASRGLAEIRRTGQGMQLHLTPLGESLAIEREREATNATADISWTQLMDRR